MKLGRAIPAAAVAANTANPTATAVETGVTAVTTAATTVNIGYGPTLISSMSALNTSASSLSSLLSQYNAQGGPVALQSPLVTAQYGFRSALANADSAAVQAYITGIASTDGDTVFTQFRNLVSAEQDMLRTLVYAYNYITQQNVQASVVRYLNYDSTTANALASDLRRLATGVPQLAAAIVYSGVQSSAYSQAASAYGN